MGGEMRKQEEIREGLRGLQLRRWDTSTFYLVDPYIDKILSYLHSQGVVIRMDLDQAKMRQLGFSEMKHHIAELYKAGYVLVEPLIEGEK
jgi:hypothetical protein